MVLKCQVILPLNTDEIVCVCVCVCARVRVCVRACYSGDCLRQDV